MSSSYKATPHGFEFHVQEEFFGQQALGKAVEGRGLDGQEVASHPQEPTLQCNSPTQLHETYILPNLQHPSESLMSYCLLTLVTLTLC